jgi:hypothetical protein
MPLVGRYLAIAARHASLLEEQTPLVNALKSYKGLDEFSMR